MGRFLMRHTVRLRDGQIGVALVLAACGRLNFAPIDGGDASSGVVIPGAMTVQVSGYPDSCPKLAWSGTEIGVLYREQVSTTYNFVFRAYDVAGQQVFGPFNVATGVTTPACPALVWAGAQYIAAVPYATTGRREIYITTITSSGVGASTNVTNDTNESLEPRLVYRNGTVELLWNDVPPNGTFGLRALPLSATGAPLGASIALGGLATFNQFPNIVATTTGFAAVWIGSTQVRVQAIDATGSVPGPETIVVPGSSIGATSTGPDVLAAWSDQSALTTAIFDSAGTITSGPFMHPSTVQPARYSIAWSGADARALYVALSNSQVHLVALAASGDDTNDVTLGPAASGNTTIPEIVWAGDRYAAAFHNDGGAWLTLLPP